MFSRIKNGKHGSYKMKKLIWFTFVVMLIPALASAQYKSQTKTPEMREVIAAPTNLFLGFLNSNKLTMNHSFSSSFSTGGGGSIMMNAYVNSINYQFNDKLWLNMDLGIMNSPYNSYLKNSPAQDQLNSTKFFGGGELNYRPSDKMQLSLGVYSTPYLYQGGYYYSPLNQHRFGDQ